MTAPREALAAALDPDGDGFIEVRSDGFPTVRFAVGPTADAILAALAASGWVLRREGDVSDCQIHSDTERLASAMEVAANDIEAGDHERAHRVLRAALTPEPRDALDHPLTNDCIGGGCEDCDTEPGPPGSQPISPGEESAHG